MAMRLGVAQMPCELAAKTILPSIRAAVAKILVEEYGIPRYRAARLLNTTPAAITNYLEGRRGSGFLDKIMNNPELLAIIKKISKMLAEGSEGQTGKDGLEYQKMICTICSSVNPLIEDREAHMMHVTSVHFKSGSNP